MIEPGDMPREQNARHGGVESDVPAKAQKARKEQQRAAAPALAGRDIGLFTQRVHVSFFGEGTTTIAA